MKEREVVWNQRSFPANFPFLMASEISFGKYYSGLDKVLILALGIQGDGVTEILSYTTSREVFKKDTYLNFMTNLNDRGIRNPLLWTGPDGPEFTEATMEVFRRSDIQHCVRQRVFSSLRKVEEIDKNIFQVGLNDVFKQKEIGSFLRGMSHFRNQWKSKYTDITDSLEEHLTFSMTFFKYPPLIHPYIKSSFLLHNLQRQIINQILENSESAENLDSWLPSLAMERNQFLEKHPIPVFHQICQETTLQIKEKYNPIHA